MAVGQLQSVSWQITWPTEVDLGFQNLGCGAWVTAAIGCRDAHFERDTKWWLHDRVVVGRGR